MEYEVVIVDMDKDIEKAANNNSEGFSAKFYETVNNLSAAVKSNPIDISTEFGLYQSKLPEQNDNVTYIIAGDSFFANETARKIGEKFKVLTCPDLLMNGHQEPINSKAHDVQEIAQLENATVLANKEALMEFIKK